jgi:hypothetical protein
MSAASSAEEPETFVTVIIEAHGSDLKDKRANREQKDTLRKLTVAGKCGNLVSPLMQMDESLFRVTAALAREDKYSSSARKLHIVREYMRDPMFSFPGALQHNFVVNLPEVVARISPKESDWFSVSKVKYDHSYAYTVNDERNPWERRDFGLWFADGSPHAQKIARFRHDGGSLYRCDILKQVIDPAVLPEKSTFFNFKTSMFELARKIKEVYRVKIVNFIDIGCRNVPPPAYPRLNTFAQAARRLVGLHSPESSDLSDGLSPMAQRASPDPPTIIKFGGRDFEVHKVPSIRGIISQPIPDGWIYGKFIDTDEAYYINPTDRLSISQSDWDGKPFKKAKLTSQQPWTLGGIGGKPRRTFKNKNKRKSKCGKRRKGNNKSMRRSTMKQKHRRRNK